MTQVSKEVPWSNLHPLFLISSCFLDLTKQDATFHVNSPLPGLSSLMASTVQWGAWLEIGMAAANPSTFKHLAQKGISVELGWLDIPGLAVSRAGFVCTNDSCVWKLWTKTSSWDWRIRWTVFVGDLSNVKRMKAGFLQFKEYKTFSPFWHCNWLVAYLQPISIIISCRIDCVVSKEKGY